jgi:hypothetical protein
MMITSTGEAMTLPTYILRIGGGIEPADLRKSIQNLPGNLLHQ